MYKQTDKDIIRPEDLALPGAVTDYLGKELKDLVAYLPVVQTAIKQMATSISADLVGMNLPTMDVASLKKFQDLQAKANDATLLNVKYKKLEADANNALSKQRQQEFNEKKKIADADNKSAAAKKKEEEQAKRNESAYAKLNAQYREQVKIYKDLAAKKELGIRLTEDEAKAMEAAKLSAQAFDTKLKGIDYTVGQAQRNVGNYHNQLNTLGKSMKGFSALGNMLARALGIDTEIFMVIKETAKGMKDLGTVTKGVTIAKEGEAAAHVANTGAIKAETAATGLSTASTLLLTAGVIAAGIAVIAYVGYLQEEQAIKDAIKRSDERNLELLQEISEEKKRIVKDERENAIDRSVVDGTITDELAARLKVQGDYQDKLKLLRESEIKDLKEQAKILGLTYAIDPTTGGDIAVGDKEKIETFEKIKLETRANYAYLERLALKSSNEELTQIETNEEKERQEKLKELLEKAAEERKRLWEFSNEQFKAGFTDWQKDLEKINKEIEALWKFSNDMFKKGFEDFNKELDEIDKKIADWKKANDSFKQGFLEWQKDLSKVDKDILKEKFDKIRATEDAITDALQESLAKRSEIQQAADQKDIDYHKRMIDIQSKLAAEGKDNVLAEELAADTRAEEKKLQDQKRAARLQEDLTLLKTFSDTLNQALESNKPFFQAFSEAGVATGLVKSMFSSLFSGSFYDGTEDTGGRGEVDNKGGKIAIVHPHERILTREQNEKLGGISNEDLVNTFTNFYKPNFDAANVSTTVVRDRSPEILASTMSRKIDELKEVISSKPTHHSSLGRLGEWTDIIEERGMKRMIHHKKQSSRPSLRTNG
jgi:hypothetical protein